MTNNNYSWNETLKFSWGHIIAFVALIFISYVTYMGDFYQNGGDFKSSAIKVFSIDIVLLLTFIGAQVYKGTDEKFNRSIIIERILICLCPIAFIWAMLPYNHFWNVFSEREQIESKFNAAIDKSRQMFSDYESYTNDRIGAYDAYLSEALNGKEQNRARYFQVGFKGNNDAITKDNYVTTLKLQLQSQNTDSLKIAALKWIDEANQGASVWNAFLVGNVQKISDAVEGWNQTLLEVSRPVLSNEPKGVSPFDTNKESFKSANSSLSELQDLYKETKGVSMNTIWSAIILFLMLLFPYLLQKRNTRANGLYYLIPISTNQATHHEVKYEKEQIDNSNDNENNIVLSLNDNNADSSDDIYGGTF